MFKTSMFGWRLALLAAGILHALAPARARAEPVAYTGGHGDIGLAYEGGGLAFRYRFDATATLDGKPRGEGRDRFAPDEVVVHAGADSYGSTFSDAYQAFLGATSAYSFGMNSSRTKPFLGIAAQDPTLPTADWIDPHPDLFWSTWLGRINFEITGVSYEGDATDAQFALFSYGSSGPSAVYSTYSGDSRVVNMPMPGHGHYEWAFSEAGVYEVTLKAWGVHVRDGYRETSTTLRFEIASVPEPSAIVLAGSGFALMLAVLRGRRTARTIGEPGA